MGLFKSYKVLYLLLISLSVLPFAASADISVEGVFQKGTELAGSIIIFLEVLAVAVFLWGIVKYISASGNPEKRKQAKDLIIYGLIGMFVLVSFIGIIYILQNTIFEGPPPMHYTPPDAPVIPPK